MRTCGPPKEIFFFSLAAPVTGIGRDHGMKERVEITNKGGLDTKVNGDN
jgi:hypothetical protein